MTPKEFKESIRGYAKGMKNSSSNSFRSLASAEHPTPTKEQLLSLPANVDWRE
jgi:hypothetical protein